MDYGRLMNRAWAIVRDNLFLILLGVLMALTSGSFNGSGTNYNFSGDNLQSNQPDATTFTMPDIPAWSIGVAIAAIGFAMLIGLILWVLSVAAHGGLVGGVNGIEDGQQMTFGTSWRRGWTRIGALVGISIIPALPILLMVGIGLFSVLTTVGLSQIFSGDVGSTLTAVVGSTSFILFAIGFCIILPIALILSLLAGLAVQACVGEGLGIMASYRRAWHVISQNLGPAIILFLIQLAIGLGLGLVLFFPSLCCLLWPLLILVRGAVTTYFTTLWTLAWREWTGKVPAPVAVAPVG